MIRRGALALLALAGCGAPAPTTIDLSQDGRHVGFLVRTDGEGVVTAVEGPFGTQDGRLWFGRRPQLTVADGSAALVVVADLDDLAARRPGFRADLAEELELVPSSDPLERAERDGIFVGRVPFPASTRIWRAVGGAADAEALDAGAEARRRFTEAWQAGLPFDPEHCRDTLGTHLAPWNALSDLLPLHGDDFDTDLRRVAPLDRDLVLANSGTQMFVIDRARPLTPADRQGPLPKRVVANAELWPQLESPIVQTLVADPTETPSARAIALVRDRRATVDETHLVRIGLGPQGVTEVRTSTTLPGNLEVLAIDEDGRFLVGGTEGRVYFGAVNTDALEVERILDARTERFRAATATGNSAAPWIVTGRIAIYERLAASDRWTQTILSRVGESLHLEGLAAAGPEDGRQLWAGGTSGALYVRRDGVWARATPAFPPRLAICGAATDGPRPVYEDTIDALDITGGGLSIMSDDCVGLVRIRLSDGCSTVLQLGDRRIEPSEGALRGLSSQRGQLIGVSPRGQVWSLD